MPETTHPGRWHSRGLSYLVLVMFLAGICLASHADAQQLKVQVEKKPKYIPSGRGQERWNVTRHTIPIGDMRGGGPPKDGIPALTNPAFVSAAEANHVLHPSDIVLGVAFDGVAKAYPIRILNWHEVVNDNVGKQPVLVSW